jgi:LacI family transcriptional regulator, lactose operon repressor
MVLKKKKVTIRDVAQEAGVSYQTVSRVLNESDTVARSTRKRVLQAVHDLDYTPNKVAKMLTTNRSYTLELLVVDVLHGGRFADSIKNMAYAARDAGYGLLVTTADVENLELAFNNAAARLTDGVIMYAPTMRITDEQLLALSDGMPIVRRDYAPDSRLAWVGFDQVYATRMAVEYLIDLGHRQIAAIPPSERLINGFWRRTAWEATLRQHGLEPGPVDGAEYTMRSAYDAACRILATGKPFTAILVGSDTMTLGVLRALREHGCRVPEDISVLSFDNAELSAYTDPPLSTIHFKFAQQDAMAVKYLVDLLNNPEMELHQRILLPDLVIRESTRKL